VIAHLRGKLISKRPGQAVVEAGGVGYDVVISVPTFTELPGTGAEVALHVHTHVREDALALFGFGTNDEKQLFLRLISVSGVGPKLAMTILSGMPSAAEIVGAIRGSDVARLTKIPGVGKKTAERLALELKDKLDSFGVAPAKTPAHTPLEEDVLSALMNLGYQRPQAERAVAANGGKASASFDALFRQALASLSK
jgi:Holliday junction DNA helicase RuvA